MELLTHFKYFHYATFKVLLKLRIILVHYPIKNFRGIRATEDQLLGLQLSIHSYKICSFCLFQCYNNLSQFKKLKTSLLLVLCRLPVQLYRERYASLLYIDNRSYEQKLWSKLTTGIGFMRCGKLGIDAESFKCHQDKFQDHWFII